MHFLFGVKKPGAKPARPLGSSSHCVDFSSLSGLRLGLPGCNEQPCGLPCGSLRRDASDDMVSGVRTMCVLPSELLKRHLFLPESNGMAFLSGVCLANSFRN